MLHSSTSNRLGRSAPVVAFGACLLLTACGSSSSKSSPKAVASTTAPTSTAPSAASSSAAAASTVTATETEFKIVLSTSTFTPGSYTFDAVNKGKIPHALTIVGPGVPSASTSTITPGDSASLKVTLKDGTYEIYCPVGNHKSLGMDLHITVTG